MGTAVAATGAMAAPMVNAAGRVVVVGGGAGGATAARYIAKDSAGEIDVTLIEPSRQYYTCFFSNLYLGGFRDINSLGHSYGGGCWRGQRCEDGRARRWWHGAL